MLIQVSISRMHSGITNPKDYLVIEDVNVKSTWHLPVSVDGVLNRRLMGNAHAALLSPNGFRGNKYAGPNKKEAIKKLKALYKKIGAKFP